MNPYLILLIRFFLSLMWNGLLVEVLVSLLQVKEDLLSALKRRRPGDPVVDASQKLLEQRLQLHVILSRQLRHVYIGTATTECFEC